MNLGTRISLMLKRPKMVVLHLLGAAFIITLQSMLIKAGGDKVTIKGLLTFIVQVGVYYANLFLVAPLIGDYRHEKKLLLRLGSLILIYIIFRGWIISGISIRKEIWQFIFSIQQLVLSCLQLILVFGISFFVGLYHISNKRKKDYFMIQSIMAQLQLNPHLLFNALNFIDAKAAEALPEVSRSVQQLAGIIRHSLIDINHIQKILLKAEVEQMRNYISLYGQLADKDIYIDFAIDLAHAKNGLEIPPLLLITFLENVFKYAVLDDEETPATINLSVHGNRLEFHTYNYKRSVSSLPSGGFGINNSSKILDYYYPGRHTLHVSGTEETFTLTLKIKL